MTKKSVKKPAMTRNEIFWDERRKLDKEAERINKRAEPKKPKGPKEPKEPEVIIKSSGY
jgi:hypothetical protein